MIGFIIGIILLGLFVGGIVAAIHFYNDDRTVSMVVAVCLAIISLISFIIVPFSIRTIDAGELAVVKHLGKTVNIREAGIYYDLWVTNKYVKYDSKVQSVELSTMAYSSDAQTMDIQMTLQYEVMPDKVMDITNRYGKLAALETRIQSIVIEKTKSVLSSYKAMDIIANRASMSPEVEEAVKNVIGEEYYVNIVAVVLTNIDFSDAFEKAVEDKMIAEQKQLKADYENATKIANAETEAKTKILEAESTAKANELLETSITDKIIKQRFIDKWDGKLPEVISGDGDLGFMIGE